MPTSRASDEQITEWALAARDGDRAAQEQFIRATQRDVWRFVAHLAGTTSLADDLAQDTYLRALRSLPRFAARSSARTWLLSIARRTVIDHIRAVQVRPRQANVEDWQAVAEHRQPSGLPGFDEGVALGHLLDTLTAERREAFVLTQVLGLSYAETGEVCDCPVGTIRSRIARAREDLIELMRADETAFPGRSAG